MRVIYANFITDAYEEVGEERIDSFYKNGVSVCLDKSK